MSKAAKTPIRSVKHLLGVVVAILGRIDKSLGHERGRAACRAPRVTHRNRNLNSVPAHLNILGGRICEVRFLSLRLRIAIVPLDQLFAARVSS